MALQLAVQFLCRKRRLCEYQDPFYRLIQAVDDRQVWLAFFRGRLIDMILNKTFHIGRACPPALGWNSVRLYAHQYVGVLI